VEITLNQINLALFSTEFIKEPKAFEEAKNYKTKGGVWEVIDEKEIPINQLCIKNKWIKEMEFSVKALWHMAKVKSQKMISMKVLLLL
jgi:hypothetical protein